MIKKLLKSFVIFLVILGISFSNIPFYALTGLIDSYEKTSGIVDKVWLLEQNHKGDVVDKFISLRNISEKLKIQEAMAAVSIRNVGAYVNGTANLTPVIPATAAVGDMMLLAYGTKPYNDAPTIDQGWLSIGSATDGTVAAGIDVGSMQTRIYYKQHTGSEVNPIITNGTNNVSGAVIIAFQKGASEVWEIPVGAGGGDATAGTGFSVTASANPGITSGDMLVGYAAIRSDAGAQSAITITATGLTVGAFTESPASDLITTAGGDMAMSGGYRLVTAGTASAAPVYASTLAVAHTGSAFMVRLRVTAPSYTTTLSNFVSGEPGNSTIAPGASGMVDSFGLQTSGGADTVSAATVGIAAGMGQYIQTVAITNDAGGTTYCSAAPSGDSASLSTCGIPVSITNTQFKIKLTANAHASMPAPDGGLYNVTATVTGFTSGNSQAGTDSGSSTLTIDNDSPGATTGANATSGENGQSTVSWTPPGDGDLDPTNPIYIYCKTASMIAGEAPTEGTDPAVDATACDATARMKYKGTLSGQTITSLTNGTAYYFRIYGRDTNGNFTAYSATQEVSATPSAPAATLTISASAGAKITALDAGAASQFVHNTSCTTDGTCAAFKLAAGGGAVSVTSIKITEFGTVDAYNNLANPTLIYDTDANYSNGTTGTFGSAANFAADQTITFTNAGLNIPNGSTYYFYIRFDAVKGANYPVGGNGIDFKINASSDVVSDGTESGTATLVSAASTCSVTSETCVRPNVTSITYPITSPLNGARISQSITINGAGFGTTCDGTNNRISIGGTGNVVSCTGTTFSNTSISITNFQYSSGDSYGGAATLLVRVGGTDDNASQDMYVYPDITDTTNPTAYFNAAREYSASDSDGVITINGNHFGTSQGSGSVTVLGQTASVVSWGASAIQIQIPTTIGDGAGGASDYLGNIIVYQGTGGNSSTFDTYGSGTYRILPRILSFNPTQQVEGSAVEIVGNHLCQNSGTCPPSLDANNKVTFTSAVDATVRNTWVNGDSSTVGVNVNVPTGAVTGNVVVKSNTYDSNALSFTVQKKPNTPTRDEPTNGANVSLTPAIKTTATDPNGDDVQYKIEIATNNIFTTGLQTFDQTASQTGWSGQNSGGGTRYTSGTQGVYTVQTALACGTTYYWRTYAKDPLGSNQWSNTQGTDQTFITPSCGPDATSITNNDELALTDGGRIGHLNIAISGAGFGTATDGNQANCAGGAGTGCVKIGGTSGQIIADSRVTAWGPASITIQLSLTDLTTTYGGLTTDGLIVYAAGISDSNGLTFYIYPEITSLSVTEAREGDTITINGNKLGTGSSGGNVTILGVAATIGTWTETSISATVPEGINDATDSGYVIVTQGTGSNNKPTNSTDAQASLAMLPRITSLTTPADAPDSFSAWQGLSITVNGSHFGSYNAANSRTSVNGSTVDPGAGNWGVSAITLTVPAAATNNGSTQATRGDTKTSNNYSTFYVLPKIISTGPTDGEAQEGDVITISGNHFCGGGGACANLPTVRFYNTGQTVDATANSGATNASLAVTVPSSISDSINTYNLEIVRSSAGGQDDGKSSANTTRNNFSYTILPDITDITNPTAYTNAAREYSASDSDGIITVNGKHFGTAGTVTVLGQTATQQTTDTCLGSAYQNICVGIRIPETIGDGAGGISDYLGNIVLTRTVGPADSKTDTYGGGNYRILPRITSLSPSDGAENTSVTIIGNHLCQAGSTSCPGAFSYTTPISNVKFGAVNATAPTIWNWTNGNSSTSGVDVKAPAGSGFVAVKVISGVGGFDYESNTKDFSYVSTTPTDPTDLKQFESNGSTPISLGEGVNSGNVVLKGDSTALIAINMVLEVEVKQTYLSFTGTPTASSSVQGPGIVFNDVAVTVSGLTDGLYHWRARAKNYDTNETSNWISFGGNADGEKDFYVDATGPVISFVTPTKTDIQATITWTTDESATQQVAYGTSCPTGQADAAATFNALTSTQPSSPAGSGLSHSVVLSGLIASTNYYYMVRSADIPLSNYSYNPATANSCNNFTTDPPQTRIMKTLEFYIEQNTATGGTLDKTYDVYISESKSNRSNIKIQSAIIEIFGTSAGGSGDINVNTKLNSEATGLTYTLADPGAGKSISWKVSRFAPTDSSDSKSIKFDCVYCTDNAGTNNRLEISVSPSTTSLLSAKLILTYYYEPL